MFLKHTEQIMTLSLPMGPFRTVLCLAVVLTALLFYAVPMYTLYDIVEKQLNIPFFSVEEQKYYIRGGTISKYGMRLVFILLSNSSGRVGAPLWLVDGVCRKFYWNNPCVCLSVHIPCEVTPPRDEVVPYSIRCSNSYFWHRGLRFRGHVFYHTNY